MNKNCNNCYWKNPVAMPIYCTYKKEFKGSVCNNHDFKCSECADVATHKLNNSNECYCAECLMEEFNVTESTETHYYLEDEYLGSDDDLEGVMSHLVNLNSEIVAIRDTK